MPGFNLGIFKPFRRVLGPCTIIQFNHCCTMGDRVTKGLKTHTSPTPLLWLKQHLDSWSWVVSTIILPETLDQTLDHNPWTRDHLRFFQTTAVVTQPASNWFRPTEFVDSHTETVQGYLCFQDSWAYRPKPCRQDGFTSSSGFVLRLYGLKDSCHLKLKLQLEETFSVFPQVFRHGRLCPLALAGLSAILEVGTMDRGRQCSHLPGLHLMCTPDPSVYSAGKTRPERGYQDTFTSRKGSGQYLNRKHPLWPGGLVSLLPIMP